MKKEAQILLGSLMAMAGEMDLSSPYLPMPNTHRYRRRRDDLPQEVQDTKILKADQKRKRRYAKKKGIPKELICREIGCYGILREQERDGYCTCDIRNPPCSYCTSPIMMECEECGAEFELLE